jgi:hypothetical protein
MERTKLWPPSLGLSSVDPSKVLLEHNVPSRSYTIFREQRSSSGAAEEASIQSELLNNRLRQSVEKLTSSYDLARHRTKSNRLDSSHAVVKEATMNLTSMSHLKTMFEVAFEKVSIRQQLFAGRSKFLSSGGAYLTLSFSRAGH